MKLPVSTTSTEYASADTMILDEAGIELMIDGEFELGASFESLDSFQLAYAVLPEDFEREDRHEGIWRAEQNNAACSSEEELEITIWIASQELAQRRGYLRK